MRLGVSIILLLLSSTCTTTLGDCLKAENKSCSDVVTESRCEDVACQLVIRNGTLSWECPGGYKEVELTNPTGLIVGTTPAGPGESGFPNFVLTPPFECGRERDCGGCELVDNDYFCGMGDIYSNPWVVVAYSSVQGTGSCVGQ